ncbi:MAG TPA: nuclear transport factor 2 family protein [Ramlibacter sp.]|nr:nuclear transport factor 2 family protein [Ramlibacter sp.]
MDGNTMAAHNLMAERDCEALTLRFFEGLDEHNAAACLACFHEEGVWERQGEPLRGHAGILQALQKRPADRRTAHAVSNVRVERTSPTTATVNFLLVAYEGHAPAGAPEPAARVAGIRRCRDEMHLTGAGWKIVRKASNGLFNAASLPAA